MKIKTWTLVFSLMLTLALQAQDQEVPGFKEKMRPWIEKIVGTTWSEKLLGAKPEEINIPALPKLAGDSKSTAVYEKKTNDKKLNITKEEEANIDFYFIRELHEAVRGLQPQGDEMSKWQNVLSQGGSREGVYRALVLDDQYARLENFNKESSETVVQFANWFLPRFIGQNFTSPEKINFYTMKREVAEKALEMIDTLSAKRGDMENWYAVFSAELAQKYPTVFKSDLRKSPLKKRHQLWAQKSPEQHIKSETVIKIHLVLNVLGR